MMGRPYLFLKILLFPIGESQIDQFLTNCFACMSTGGDAFILPMVCHRATLDEDVTRDGFRPNKDLMIQKTTSAYTFVLSIVGNVE